MYPNIQQTTIHLKSEQRNVKRFGAGWQRTGNSRDVGQQAIVSNV